MLEVAAVEVTGGAGSVPWIIVKIVAIILPLLLGVAYLTFAERKIIGYIQVRIGPNRVGPRGWLQPIADVVKLVLKRGHHPDRGRPVLVFSGAHPGPGAGLGRLGGGSIRR